MIKEIIKTDITVEEIENYIIDVEKILVYLATLTKEYASKESLDNWLVGPMPLLAECYTNLSNLIIYLRELLVKFTSRKAKTKKFKLSQENLLVIGSYIKNFKQSKTELLHLHWILVREFDIC